MTAIGDIIFAIVWFGALIFAIRLMSNGWSLMTNKEEWEQKEPPDEMKKAVKESTHPEMQDLTMPHVSSMRSVPGTAHHLEFHRVCRMGRGKPIGHLG